MSPEAEATIAAILDELKLATTPAEVNRLSGLVVARVRQEAMPVLPAPRIEWIGDVMRIT